MADIHISHLVKVYPGTTEPATDDVGHEHVHRVAADVDGCQSHRNRHSRISVSARKEEGSYGARLHG